MNSNRNEKSMGALSEVASEEFIAERLTSLSESNTNNNNNSTKASNKRKKPTPAPTCSPSAIQSAITQNDPELLKELLKKADQKVGEKKLRNLLLSKTFPSKPGNNAFDYCMLNGHEKTLEVLIDWAISNANRRELLVSLIYSKTIFSFTLLKDIRIPLDNMKNLLRKIRDSKQAEKNILDPKCDYVITKIKEVNTIKQIRGKKIKSEKENKYERSSLIKRMKSPSDSNSNNNNNAFNKRKTPTSMFFAEKPENSKSADHSTNNNNNTALSTKNQ